MNKVGVKPAKGHATDEAARKRVLEKYLETDSPAEEVPSGHFMDPAAFFGTS